MKGELPSLFSTFAFWINGAKADRCFERHRWALFAATCIHDSHYLENRLADRNAVPATIHPEEGE
jgi:hypothetical protein